MWQSVRSYPQPSKITMGMMTPQPTPPQLRPATVADAAAVFAMATELATSAAPEREAFERSLTMIVNDPRQCLMVAAVPSGLVGYICGLVHPAFHANGSVAWVEELYVDPGRRGTGLGRALMDQFEAWAQQAADTRYIAVATRRAHDFYAAIGYAESATYFKKTLE